jgi:hypothetical protein
MDHAFEVHMLNEKGKEKAAELARIFDATLTMVQGIARAEKGIEHDPRSARELAIVRTKLEEACFFAKKAMAVNPEYQASK